MKRWNGMLVACLMACGTADDTDKDTTDTDVTDTDPGSDTDGTTSTDTDDTTTTDTDDTQVDDTDDTQVAFSPVGTWSLTNGAVSATTGSLPNCSPPGTPASNPSDTMTWTETSGIELTFSGFTIPYDCTRSGDELTCTPEYGTVSNRTGYSLNYWWPMTITMGDDGEATVSRTAEASCVGDCSSAMFCPSSTVSWDAVKQ